MPRCHIAIQALVGNVTRICICKYTIMYINHQIVNIINTQHNILTITLHVKLSQGSDLSLRRDTNLLQWNKNHATVTTNLIAVKYLNNLGFVTWANSLQRKPHSLQQVLYVSAKQSMKFKTQLTVHNSNFLTITRTPLATMSTLNVKGLLTQAYSLQRESHLLQWVLPVLNSQTHILEQASLFVIRTYSL